MHTQVLLCWLVSLNQLSMHAGMHADASCFLQTQHNNVCTLPALH